MPQTSMPQPSVPQPSVPQPSVPRTSVPRTSTSRTRLSLLLAGPLVALALAGCNEALSGDPVASAPLTPGAVRTAQGSGCAAEIDRYQAITKEDLATGNLEDKVYAKIQSELSRASAACSAGRAVEAHKIVAQSKAAHGYRA